MMWRELDHANSTWTIPADRSKNGREHILILPLMAWQLIEAIPRRSDYLFGRHGTGYTNYHLSKQALDKRSGVTGWTLHDLRRAAATGMANLGIEPFIIEAVLNHISAAQIGSVQLPGHKTGVAGVYNRANYQIQIRKALALWSDHVRSIIVEGSDRKVIGFPATAGERADR